MANKTITLDETRASPMMTRKRSAARLSPEPSRPGVLRAIVDTVRAASKRVRGIKKASADGPASRSASGRSTRSRAAPSTPVLKHGVRSRDARPVGEVETLKQLGSTGARRTRNSMGQVSRLPVTPLDDDDDDQLTGGAHGLRQRKRLKASHELESALDSGLLQLERPDDVGAGGQSASTPTGSAEPTGAVAAPEALPGTPKRDVQPSWDAFITSVGPCPSQSVRASILKSPTPPRRSMLDATPRLGRVVRMLIPPVDLLEVEMETRRALHAEAQLASERQATAVEAGRGVADDAALPETGRAAAEPRPSAVAVEAAPTTTAAEQVSETGLERAQSAQSSIAFAERTASGADEAGPSASEWWDPLDRLKAGQARAVLHTSHQPLSLQSARGEPSLLCREAQIQRLRAWLLPRLTSGSSASTSYGGSCYVSGPPGTGKTLTVCGLLRSLHVDLRANQGTSDAPVLACINCMRLSSGRQVAGRALEALTRRAAEEDPIVEPVGAGASRSDEEALSQLRSLLLPPRAQRRLILVLDELDGLLDGARWLGCGEAQGEETQGVCW